MAYTEAQLGAFWTRYVTMRGDIVIALPTLGGAAYEPDFVGMFNYEYLNKMYGFADYRGSCVFPNNGNNKYIGG